MKKAPLDRRKFSYLKHLHNALNHPTQRLARQFTRSRRPEETMVFIESAELPNYPPLDFKPLLLRSYVLVLLFTFFLASLSSIIVLLYFNRKRDAIHYAASAVHVTIRYLPIAVGQVTTHVWGAIRDSLGRITPFMSMAAPRSTGRSINPRWPRTVGAAYYPRMNFDLQSGHWLYLAVFISNIAAHSIPALQSVLLSSIPEGNGWGVRVSSPAAYSLILIYSLLCCVIIAVAVRLWNRATGLKWNPASIAEQVALLHKSNIRWDFHGLETASREKVRLSLINRTYRLGYWKIGTKKKVWYGIASEYEGPAVDNDLETTNGHLDNYDPYREVYWQVSNFAMSAAIVTACGAATAAAFIRASQHHRYQEFHLSISLSHANFILQALPTTFSHLFTYFWSHVDIFHRSTQPFVGMYKSPKRASESILLDYLSSPPVIVTYKAVRKRHWKVAYFSVLALASNVLPPLVGALFTTIRSGNGVTVTVDIQTLSYIAAIFFLYAVSVPIAWPTRERRLPRNVDSLADLFCFCYASKLPDDPEFDLSDPNHTREEFVKALCHNRRKYRFGLYRGTDRKKHFGIHLETERIR